MHLYTKILHPLSLVSENQEPYTCLTERHLQAIWFEQKHLNTLLTADEEIIEVISPGIWNGEAGPDFLKAHLRIGCKEYKGDIELHLNDEGWYAHRHHHDPRYNHVILHLSYERTSRPRPIIRQNGQEVLALHLNASLKMPLDRIIKLINFETYPYKKITRAGECAHWLFKSLEEKKIEAFFKSAALWRLEKKSAYLQYRVPGISLQLMLGIVMALGYKHNAEAFSELFELLVTYRHLSEQEIMAIAMGCSGFFDGRQSKQWELSPVYRYWRCLWWEKQTQIILQVNFRLDRVRPLNHPVRRLAYLVKLVLSPLPEELWGKMLTLWQLHCHWMESEKHALHLQKALMQLIPGYEDAYWNTHFTFEQEVQNRSLSLIGEDLKREMLINAFLPLLYTSLKEEANPDEMQSFYQFYSSFKSSGTSKTRYLNQRFFAESSHGHLLKSAQIEQGAYQLHTDFCLQFESSCVGCPFIERMQMEGI